MRIVTAFTTLVLASLLHLSAVAADEPASGNVLSKKFSDDLEVEGIKINKYGDKGVLEFEDQFWGISVLDGKTLWTKKIEDNYKQSHDLIRWVDDNIVTVPTDKSLEWIDGTTGKVLASVKFPGDGTEDIVENINSTSPLWAVLDDINVRRFGSLLIVPFSDNYQVIDLVNRKLVYESSEPMNAMRYHIWGHTLLIGGKMDTVVMFDMVNPKVLYKHDMDDDSFNANLFQPLIRYKDQAVLMFDDHVVLVDVASGKKVASLEMNATDWLTYEPQILNNTLHLLIQEEARLSLLNVATGQTIWKKGADEEKFGHMVQAKPYQNSDILLVTSNADDELHVRRISGTQGNVLWSTPIVRSQETFEPGFYYSKSFGAYLTGAAQFNSATTGGRNYNLDSLGIQTYWSQLRLDSATAQSDDDFMALLSKMCIHELASGKGMVRFLNTNAGSITVVAQGLVDKAWAGKVEEDVDGQGVFHLDPTSGQITKSVPVKFVVEDNESTIPDVYHYHTPIPSVHGTSILGTKSITLVQHNGDVDVANFPADEFINSIGYGADYRVVNYEDEADHYATWKLLLTAEGIKKQLIGYADETKHLCVFSDTTLVSTTQRFEGGTLFVYPLMSEIPKQWPSPLWKMDEDALDKLNIGSLEATLTSNDVLGIHPHGDVILMLGEEGFSYADAKTGCVKSIQWEGWTTGQSFKRRLRLFDPVKGGYLFDMGPSAGVIKVNGTCDITRIGYSEEKPDDLWIVYSDVTARIVFVNTADNMLNIYQLDR